MALHEILATITLVCNGNLRKTLRCQSGDWLGGGTECSEIQSKSGLEICLS